MKKFLVTFAIALAAFATNGIYGSITPVYAEQYYATTYRGVDYYVESDEVSGTRSGLTYAGVYMSNGEYYTWCFDSYKSWKYKYWPGGIGSMSQATGWKPVSESQVANDILYVALNIKASKR